MDDTLTAALRRRHLLWLLFTVLALAGPAPAAAAREATAAGADPSGAAAAVATGEMPIIAYMGVPDWRTTDADFRLLSECGFTVSLYPYRSLDLLVKACRTAHKYGVKVLAPCPEMIKDPVKAATTLKGEPGFFGYMLQDEPTVVQLAERESELQRLKRIDSTHCFYINLLPHYGEEWLPINTVSKYKRYVKAAAEMSTQQLSFDHYSITKNGLRSTWYHNLEMIRSESLASGKPFWAFVLSVPHHVYPMPTLATMRLQAYSNLAYGAQAIQYFTYWTPGPDEGFDYHDAPVTHQGVKTKTYAVVQQMNRELRQVARLFYGARVTAVNHLVTIPEGTTRLQTLPAGIKTLKVTGRKGALVSQFRKDGHQYMAIVNKNYEQTMKVRIKLNNSTPRRLTKQLAEETVASSYTVQPGDILLFRLK